MVPVVLATGATGNQGSGAVRHLVAAKAKVHALIRDLSSPAALELERLGAKLCLGTFDDVNSLKAAAVGTTAVFLNVSPSMAEHESELRHAKNIIQAAKEAGSVTNIVYSSVLMAGKHESFPNWGPDYPLGWYWTSKAEIEPLHFSCPTAISPDLGKRHVFLTAYNPDNAIMVLDPGDGGKFAAGAILEPETYNHHEIDLGVEALTPDEIARSLSKAGGKDIKTEFYPAAEASALSKVNPLIASQLWANDVGYKTDVKALKKYPIKLTTFNEYLQREKSAVQNTFK